MLVKVTITLNICASIATAMGPNVNRHLKILGAGIFSTLADAKVLQTISFLLKAFDLGCKRLRFLLRC